MELPQLCNISSPIRTNGGYCEFLYQNSLLDFTLNTTPKRFIDDTPSLDFCNENLLVGTPTEIREVSQECFLSPDIERIRRGRPRAECISSLILEGSTSTGTIRCKICKRIFPREKSLQAHMRTHTGERPYVCDYPGCQRAFCQSGQLKTHQRLHTGEKPFVCSVPGCQNRFTHANRHCIDHPTALLRRDSATKRQSLIQMVSTPEFNDNENFERDFQSFTTEITETPVKPSLLRRQLTVKRSLENDIENHCDQRDQTMYSPINESQKKLCYTVTDDIKLSECTTPFHSNHNGTTICENQSDIFNFITATPKRETLKSNNSLNIIQTPTKSTLSMPNLVQLLSQCCETPKVKAVSEYRDRLLGALALIELATSPPRFM